MEIPQYRISHLCWLMIMVSVSVALARISTQFLFIVFGLGISMIMITVLICLDRWKMGFVLTWLASVLVLDLCGASLCAFGSWEVVSNPTAYPNSISLGDPPTAFVIGFLAFTPVATMFSFITTGIGWLSQNRLGNAIIDEPSDEHDALDEPL